MFPLSIPRFGIRRKLDVHLSRIDDDRKADRADNFGSRRMGHDRL